jgi:hypothetical protein
MLTPDGGEHVQQWWTSQSPRRRLLVIVAAVLVPHGGCAFYRADRCREASAEMESADFNAFSPEYIRASGQVARWCWPTA